MSKEKKPINKRKKKALVFAVSVIVIGLVSGVSLTLIDYFGSQDEKDPTNRYSDELHSYIFREPDYDLDVTTVPEYMEKDRMLHYKYGAEELGIESKFEKYGRDVKFFRDYFDTVIAGDWEKYNTLFTDHYYESEKPRNRFSPQMLYDLQIEKLWSEVEGDGERFAYNVSYRIYDNDGTYRNDLDDGGSKVLYYEIVDTGDGIKVDYIDYYKLVKK